MLNINKPKAIFLFVLVFGGIAAIYSCSKTPVPSGSASLTIVNTLPGALIVNFNDEDSIIFRNRGIGQIHNKNTGLEFALNAGRQIVNLHEINPSTFVWKDIPIVSTVLNLPVGTIASLFICGTLQNPDTFFVKDAPLPFQPSDSSVGFRFVNLSQGNTTIKVNLQSQPPGSETDNLGYKSVTAFKSYSAKANVQRYVFEFRNALNNSLLATSTINNINNPGTSSANLWRYRNFTIVFAGLPGSTGTPPTAFSVKNH